MPLVRLDIIKGRSRKEIKTILDVCHDAIVEAFEVPMSDRYQVVTQHEKEDLIIEDTGLGFTRSEDFVLITILSSKREVSKKELFYKLAVDNLYQTCGIDRENVMISISENTPADWSFGLGEAQFLNGKL